MSDAGRTETPRPKSEARTLDVQPDAPTPHTWEWRTWSPHGYDSTTAAVCTTCGTRWPCAAEFARRAVVGAQGEAQ